VAWAVAVDLVPGKLELARTFGATHLVDAGAQDVVEQVRQLTGGGVDHSFEAIGLAASTEAAFAMLRPGGVTTVVGMIPVGTSIQVPGHEFLAQKRIQGSLMGSNQFRTDMPRYVQLYRQGRLKLDELISARISLPQVNDAFAQLQTGTTARSVIVFD
jgi:S-(hydroxymethyl)glutathione dehydrogenase/alcohol dehydrogenase